MLIACHLFFGICAGVLLRERFLDQRIIPLCILGSILPDLIDKPLGHLIFTQIDDGRLIAHALAGLIIISIISLFLMRDRILATALCIGMLSHQLLDEMWKIPVNWFYPLLGEFPIGSLDNYFAWGMMRELTTLSEWIFALIILYLAFHWKSDREIPGFRMVALSGLPALLLLMTGR